VSAGREYPLLMVHTGTMKGKSTAAFGMAMRAWAAGLPVRVFQFVKGSKWRPGEETALLALGSVYQQTGQGASVTWTALGLGRPHGEATDRDRQAAAAGWDLVRRELENDRPGFYVLDEFTYPLNWGCIDSTQAVAALTGRSGFKHVVVTGRQAPPELIAAADLVVEMGKVKHPIDTGVRGQRGVEW
jgi:cob(I)alamin adenosyltransferase